MAQILEAGSAVDKLVGTSKAMDMLAAEIPALRPFITPKKMRAAAQNSTAHARHLRQLRRAYEANREAVEAFKTRHPDLIAE
jgi:hypothetical protein